jgi:hypothetical protein
MLLWFAASNYGAGDQTALSYNDQPATHRISLDSFDTGFRTRVQWRGISTSAPFHRKIARLKKAHYRNSLSALDPTSYFPCVAPRMVMPTVFDGMPLAITTMVLSPDSVPGSMVNSVLTIWLPVATAMVLWF